MAILDLVEHVLVAGHACLVTHLVHLLLGLPKVRHGNLGSLLEVSHGVSQAGKVVVDSVDSGSEVFR